MLTEDHLEFLSLKGGCTGSSKCHIVGNHMSWHIYLRVSGFDSSLHVLANRLSVPQQAAFDAILQSTLC